jgi:hypothetical protein
VWRSGQVYTAFVESVVWGDATFDFIEQVKANNALIIPAKSTLLVLDDTTTSVEGEHTYERTRCLWVETGEVVFNVSNVLTSEHSATFLKVG